MTIGLLGLGVSAGFAETPCASTPAAAVKAYESGQPIAGDLVEGYRVASWYTDLPLRVNWAQVERCGHPGWPELSIRMAQRPEGALLVSAVSPLSTVAAAGVTTVQVGRTSALLLEKTIRAGEPVRLWRIEPNLRMEMPAVSEESGGIGERIRLRVVSNQENVQVVRYVFGLVRGPADVELE
ncbi:hypothetical protein GRAN_2660 [Granulicella sibirica]|uniref:Flagella basal body P-ring formation protein FlgA C-terminal domain-containing protein n=1 Tax=Granulicella sibirica TaxID=2479048 RepID=A0A4Q0SXE4_9BACT|nr:hypothetical protein GRAN_2660 [Granulicella sibirica]